MSSPAFEPRMSAAQYLAMERAAATKHELWEGEVFAMARASLAHNLIVGNLARALGNLLVDRPCLVLPSDMKVHVPSCDGYDGSEVIANPQLIVEVLSDSTERFDRGDEFAGYRSLPSLVDYLLVAQTRMRIEHYERQADGNWLLREFGAGMRMRLRSVEGELDVDDIYRKVGLTISG